MNYLNMTWLKIYEFQILLPKSKIFFNLKIKFISKVKCLASFTSNIEIRHIYHNIRDSIHYSKQT